MSDDFPLPDTEWPATREFWAAATRGELVIPRCTGCGAWNWYPRDRCRVCDGALIGLVHKVMKRRPAKDEEPAAAVEVDDDPPALDSLTVRTPARSGC